MSLVIAGKAMMVTGANRGLDIFPDPMSQSLQDAWRLGVAKTLERQNAALVAAEPIAA